MKCNVIDKDKAPDFKERLNYDEIKTGLKSLNSRNVLDIECNRTQANNIRVLLKLKIHGYTTRYLNEHLYIKRVL